jgi:hypothetical protein
MAFLRSNRHVAVRQHPSLFQTNVPGDCYTVCLLDDHFYLVSFTTTFLELLLCSYIAESFLHLSYFIGAIVPSPSNKVILLLPFNLHHVICPEQNCLPLKAVLSGSQKLWIILTIFNYSKCSFHKDRWSIAPDI